MRRNRAGVPTLGEGGFLIVSDSGRLAVVRAVHLDHRRPAVADDHQVWRAQAHALKLDRRQRCPREQEFACTTPGAHQLLFQADVLTELEMLAGVELN